MTVYTTVVTDRGGEYVTLDEDTGEGGSVSISVGDGAGDGARVYLDDTDLLNLEQAIRTARDRLRRAAATTRQTEEAGA